MKHRRLLWHLFITYLIIALFALIAVTWYASDSFKNYSLQQTAVDLEIMGHLSEGQLVPLLKLNDHQSIQTKCDDFKQSSGARFTVIAPSGVVIADSEEDPAVMDNHGDRPEVLAALKEGYGQSIRYSYTLGQNMMYVAVAIRDSKVIIGILRISLPITSIESELNSVYVRVALAGLAVAILAALVSFYISRRISRPLEVMRREAKRFADGELTRKLPPSNIAELNSLATTLNRVAAQLHDRIQAVVRQRNEQNAVLSSMVEGVLAVDSDARLISMNEAAAKLFNISHHNIEGKTLHESIRNAALLEFVDHVLGSQESGEAEIRIYDKDERYLQVHGTVLRDANNASIGALIVLNDITRIKRLETVRQDFVANVSHELKTPVTSIKGFVETLLDGSVPDEETARHFLSIISRHADRLQAIIEDLLSLSRLEQEAEKAQVKLETDRLKPVLESAVQACDLKASEKNIKISLDCPDDISVRMNAQLLEQAAINLLDNAVKYSEREAAVQMSVSKTPESIVIKVSDEGIGIPAEHLPRLFERFYRVDKARSRKMGGTGLGLSIVKHIVQIHGGYTDVESALGQGSDFYIFLPAE
jgi:two-component system phosphate regulon sensor histidine kinase PhoR